MIFNNDNIKIQEKDSKNHILWDGSLIIIDYYWLGLNVVS